MVASLLALIVPLVVLCVVAWVIWTIIQQIPMLQPFKTVILAIFSLVVFLLVLDILGLYSFNL